VVSERDEIRFDILTGAVGAARARFMASRGSLGPRELYAVSLPPWSTT
jgi:hypothetical protein